MFPIGSGQFPPHSSLSLLYRLLTGNNLLTALQDRKSKLIFFRFLSSGNKTRLTMSPEEQHIQGVIFISEYTILVAISCQVHVYSFKLPYKWFTQKKSIHPSQTRTVGKQFYCYLHAIASFQFSLNQQSCL